MQYNNESFNYVKKVNTKSKIQEVASQLGLSPQLILGAIVEEANAEHHQGRIKKWLNKALDEWTVQQSEQASVGCVSDSVTHRLE